MDLKELNNYITEVKVDLSEFFDGSDQYITMREPTSKEFYELQDGSDGDNDEVFFSNFLKLFPKIIVDHSFQVNSQKAKAEAVASSMEKRLPIIMKVVEEFQKTIPLAKAKPQESPASQE